MYVRSKLTAPNRWALFIDGQHQAAAFLTRNKRGSVTFATNRPLTVGEVRALAVDAQELESGHLGF